MKSNKIKWIAKCDSCDFEDSRDTSVKEIRCPNCKKWIEFKETIINPIESQMFGNVKQIDITLKTTQDKI